MGSSRDIAIGPVAVVSLLLGTMLRDVIDPKLNPEAYRRLAFTATFFAGITQLALGFFRLGFLIDFISHAAIIGFMGGAAVTIALQQLKGLLGIKVFTKKTDIISVMRSVFNSTEHGWNWQTIVIGLSFLAYLLLSKHIAQKKKKLFWVSAITPLTSVILATFFVYITHAEKHGVQIEYGIQTNNTVGVDKLPDEMNDMKIRDDKEIEATVVDGDGTETGHIIFTTIGGKNGQLKQVFFSANNPIA